MSAPVDLSRLRETSLMTRVYGYLTVRERVPRFRDFIHGLDELTKSRIAKIGYDLGV